MNFFSKKIFSTLIILVAVFSFFGSAHKVNAAISRVQTVSAGIAGIGVGTSLVTVWPTATTAGNLLVAIVGVRGGSDTTITPPSGGWTLAVRSNNSTTVSTAIYYIANASSQSGSSSWNLSPSDRATLTLIEYSGALAMSVLDKTATSSDQSSTGRSGTTATTTQTNEVAVAGISANNTNRTFSAQTNGFIKVDTVASSNAGSNGEVTVFEEKILSTADTQSVSTTISSSSTWSGAIATFKASAPMLPISGNLISSVYDTTANSVSAGYNSMMWKGTLGGIGLNEGKVRFQFATASAPTGPWNFYGGATCGALDWFDSLGSDNPVELKGSSCVSAWNNKRYFRYKVQICSNDCVSAGVNTPTINDIVVNWSP